MVKMVKRSVNVVVRSFSNQIKNKTCSSNKTDRSDQCQSPKKKERIKLEVNPVGTRNVLVEPNPHERWVSLNSVLIIKTSHVYTMLT